MLMLSLRDAIVELYRRAATTLPADVVRALQNAQKKEKKGLHAAFALSVILDNIRAAKENASPMCQDTGIPVFFIKSPPGVQHRDIRTAIMRATRIATRKIPLRPNAVDVLTEKNSGDNTGAGFPVIYIDEIRGRRLIIDLMLKGSGSENIGQIYTLPLEGLQAERDLEGVRKCILDTVQKAQGKGCPPYIIGVGVGATKDQVTRLSKEQLLRRLDDLNRHPVLVRFEKRVCNDMNALGIGTIGLGGRITALAAKIGVNHRHPASYFVDVSVACWADRRARLIWEMQSSKFRIIN
jgi:fumarate hydratase class I